MQYGIIATGKIIPESKDEALKRRPKKEDLYKFIRELQRSGAGAALNKRGNPQQVSFLDERRSEVQELAQKNGYSIFVCTPPPKTPNGKYSRYS